MIAEAPTTAEAFHELIHSNYMYGLWELAGQMTDHPHPKAVAHIWPADLIQRVVKDSGEAVPVGEEPRVEPLHRPALLAHRHGLARVLDHALDQDSGEAVPVGEERRAMQLFNPGL